MAFVDELEPTYIKARVITLALVHPLDALQAFRAIELSVAVDASALGGLELPLVLTVMPPSRQNFYRHVFVRTVPSVVSFTPREGGQHLVRLAEFGHNLYWGALPLSVAGDALING